MFAFGEFTRDKVRVHAVSVTIIHMFCKVTYQFHWDKKLVSFYYHSYYYFFPFLIKICSLNLVPKPDKQKKMNEK